MDEKPYKYENLPIPTYEEATSSRPTSSQSRTGPEEISDDAERQGLLNYVPPTVESIRSSVDSLDGLEVESEAEVRREMQQMDVEDPDSDNGSHRSLLTYRFKRFTSFTSFPTFKLPSIRLPKIDWQAVDANRFVIIGRLLAIILIMGVIYVLIASDLISLGRNKNMGRRYDPESVRAYLQAGFGEHIHIENHLKHITKFPHLAGTEGTYVLGEWIAEMFKDNDLENVSTERFDVYLNYPRKDGRRVAIVGQDWEAQLEEGGEETPVFHGLSKSGDVTGPLIYANFGSDKDFQRLEDDGISVQGAIVLVRYDGGVGPGMKVKAAEDAGAAGCIIYSDMTQHGVSQRDGSPDDRLMPQDGVRRASVALPWVMGDVLSPGWAATPSMPQRLTPEESKGLANIPSIPISWQDASHLLEALHGHGKKLDSDGLSETEYWSGDQDSPKVNLKNLQDEEKFQPIYNVIGRINGWEQPTKKIIVGNHRDAWCLGATGPGSGTAIMLMMVRIFGELRRLEWQPLRTIEFVSWDGGEYNLAGSTEHVENREEELHHHGFAYLNVDAGITGGDFHADASPLFDAALRRILGRVSDPISNKTIREIWEEKGMGISPLGGGSDFAPFQHIAGTSSIDLKFSGEGYPRGSCYDNYDWIEKHGDPSLDYSSVLGQIWALLVLDLADAPLLPLDVEFYYERLSAHIEDLISTCTSLSSSENLDFSPLYDSLTLLDQQVQSLKEFDTEWHSSVYGSGGYEPSVLTVRRIDRNNRVANFETKLLDLDHDNIKGGLVNRTQFKHVITAPGLLDPTTPIIFPSILQWLDIGDWQQAQKELSKVAEIMSAAALELSF